MRRHLLLLVAFMMSATSLVVAGGSVEKIGEESVMRRETPHPVPAAELQRIAWQDTFTYPKATYIAVHFSRFDLAPGEKVVVSTPDGRYAYEFEGLGKPRTGGIFWATHVPGETCVVTYYGNGGTPGFGYIVDKIAHGFPAPEAALTPESPEVICGADNTQEAKCYQVSEPEIYNKSKSVIRLLVGGTGLCTAWLVGCEGHVMTNNHCIADQADADNVDYEIMAEGGSCATNCQTDGGCPGTILSSTALFVKTHVNLDYTLLKLPTNPTATYGYLKLRVGAGLHDERIYIPGHPAGFGKRISVTSDNLNDQSGFDELDDLNAPPCVSGSPFNDYSYFADTQPGSSGSPVIAYSDQRVVAIHHCSSPSGCPNVGVPMQLIIADLQSSNNLPACSTQQLNGTVELDYDAYYCNDLVSIKVKDDSLVGTGTVNVTIVSTTETAPETVALTETPAASGTFLGMIPMASPPAVPNNGQLSAQNGDTITVTYIDADDGSGGMNITRTDTALVDCVAPIITNVNATNITGNTAVINWTTNEPANSVVHYGLTPPGGSMATSAALVGSHAITLTGLQGCTTYYYWVGSQDAAGNAAQNDNGGSYYSFTTLANTNPSFTSTDTPVLIPDNNATGGTSTINVPDNNTVVDVNVTVNIAHSYDGDVLLSLIPPSGSPIILSNHHGSNGDNYLNTVFDDEASTPIASGTAPFTGSFKPDSLLSGADGINAFGDWKLKAVDNATLDSGTILNWTLTLTYPPAFCGPSAAYSSNAPADTCSGSGAGGGNGIVDAGEDIVLPVTVRNNGGVTLTGLTGTIATNAPGVTITRSMATYPSLTSNSTAPSQAPHFAFTVDSSVSCGTLIPFTIALSSNQGTFNDAFSVRVGTPGTSTTTYNSTDVPKPVPDVTTIESVLPIADTSTVTDVNVKVNISHTWDADLTFSLVGPEGTAVELSSGNGGSGDNYTNTIFDDQAANSIVTGSAPFSGSFKPEGVLANLNNIPANGTWKLRVRDVEAPDPGTLNSWSVTLTTAGAFVCNNCSVASPVSSPDNVVFTPGSKKSLQWGPVGAATFYNVYRGDCASLPHIVDATNDSCLAATTTTATTGEVITAVPTVSCMDWYLVRSGNAGGLGPPGNATSGPRVHNSSGPCP